MRPNGYYWVKVEKGGEWEPLLSANGGFWTNGPLRNDPDGRMELTMFYRDHELAAIGPHIEPPSTGLVVSKIDLEAKIVTLAPVTWIHPLQEPPQPVYSLAEIKGEND